MNDELGSIPTLMFLKTQMPYCFLTSTTAFENSLLSHVHELENAFTLTQQKGPNNTHHSYHFIVYKCRD